MEYAFNRCRLNFSNALNTYKKHANARRAFCLRKTTPRGDQLMSVSKWPIIKENIEVIKMWARDGLTEKQIYTNLVVGKTSWEQYKKTKPELKDALKKGKAPFIAEVTNALAKRALGFTVTETKKYVRIEDGKEVKYQETAEKYFPPDVAACSIILKNKDKDENGKTKWSDNPAKIELEREALDLKIRVEELKLF